MTETPDVKVWLYASDGRVRPTISGADTGRVVHLVVNVAAVLDDGTTSPVATIRLDPEIEY